MSNKVEHTAIKNNAYVSDYDDMIINSEDAREIAAQIEELARKNRIVLKPDDLRVTPLKGDIAFPLVVNLIILVLSAAVLVFVSNMFNQQKATLSHNDTAFSSVEGQLLQQVRQDSEGRIAEKDRDIASIRRNLMALEQSQNDALLSIEEAFRKREQELQSDRERDIAAERKRLIETGVSDEDLYELLAVFEEERFTYYRGELDKYQDQIGLERQAAQEQYQQLQNQYQQNLRTLNDERQLIQDEFRKKEDEFRITLEKSVSNEGTGRELDAAREELAHLNDQRQRDLLADNRITGMFMRVRISLQERRYEEALVQAESLERYLGQDSGSSEQRNMDMYLAQTLAQIARMELDKVNAPTDQSRQLRELQAREQDLRETIDHLRADQAQKLANAAADLEQAKAAANQGDYAGALEAYQRAGYYFGLPEVEIATLISGIRALNRLSVTVDVTSRRSEASAAAGPLLAQGNQELNGQEWQQALNTYSRLINSYPVAQQVPAAVSGIGTIFDAYLQDTVSRSEYDTETKTLKNRISTLETENSRLTRSLQAASLASEQKNQENGANIRALGNRLADMEAENSRLTLALQGATRARDQEGAILTLENRISLLETENSRLAFALEAARGGDQQEAILAFENRISLLETENSRLTQSLQEITRESRTVKLYDDATILELGNRIAILEEENTRLRQLNQELTRTNQELTRTNQELTQTNRELATASLRVSTEADQNKNRADAYQALVDAYSSYTGTSGSLRELERFLDGQETQEAFPGFTDRVKKITDEMVLAAHKEAISSITDILEVALRIQTTNTRQRYLESMKVRYSNEPNILGFVDMLMKRL
ncbi:MAG: hypothetical protein LBU17_13410 [Treponema sp.]|jgi:hypothetical protein|nr:hypothetical protein [Treponema sp.]